jgi:hypothetical protein
MGDRDLLVSWEYNFGNAMLTTAHFSHPSYELGKLVTEYGGGGSEGVYAIHDGIMTERPQVERGDEGTAVEDVIFAGEQRLDNV